MKPSDNRIQVTPSIEARAVLDELAMLTGKSRSFLVADILQEALPALQTVIDAVKTIQAKPEAAKALIDDYASRSIQSINQAQIAFTNQIHQKRGPKPKVRDA